MEAITPPDGDFRPVRNQRWKRFLVKLVRGAFRGFLLLFLLFLLGVLLPEEWGLYVIKIPYLLICGWIHYLAGVLPLVHANYEMILTGVVAFGLATVTSHWVLNRMWKYRSPVHPWRWKWTIGFSALVPIPFGISIAIGGILHQFGWLMHEHRWTGMNSWSKDWKNTSNARQIVTCLRIWSSEHDGHYPQRLQQLFADAVLDNNHILYYLPENGGTPEIFEYLPGLLDSDSRTLPLVLAPHADSSGKWIMAMNDSSVDTAKAEDVAKAILAWRQRISAHKSESR